MRPDHIRPDQTSLDHMRPDHIRPLRERVYRFMTERVEPNEGILHAGGPTADELIATLQAEAKAEGLWALGHPAELGGGGLPFLYPDLVGNDRHLFVQHLGDDPDEGWVAFGAFDPDEPSCLILLDREDKVLVNECDESVTYPLSGEGLKQYPVSIEDGEIFVDVNELTTSTTAG